MNTLRIVAWNCAGGLHEKSGRLCALEPDVAVVAECAEASARALASSWAEAGVAWTGKVASKGLAVLARPRLKAQLSVDGCVSHGLRVDIRGGLELTLLALWTHQEKGRTYPDELHDALDAHEGEIRAGRPWILVGDLNSNAIFDPRTKRGHSRFVERAASMGLVSAYHALRGEPHGAEREPTYYHRRKQAEPFHLDYAFVSEGLLAGARLEVGKPEDWLHLSDHMPLTLELTNV